MEDTMTQKELEYANVRLSIALKSLIDAYDPKRMMQQGYTHEGLAFCRVASMRNAIKMLAKYGAGKETSHV
jgi:hypothetical protein